MVRIDNGTPLKFLVRDVVPFSHLDSTIVVGFIYSL